MESGKTSGFVNRKSSVDLQVNASRIDAPWTAIEGIVSSTVRQRAASLGADKATTCQVSLAQREAPKVGIGYAKITIDLCG
jgi:hypothetical protein